MIIEGFIALVLLVVGFGRVGSVLSPVRHIGSTLERDLLMSSMIRRNDYIQQTLFLCWHEHLTVVLKQTWKLVKLSFNWNAPSTFGGKKGNSCLTQRYHTALNSTLCFLTAQVLFFCFCLSQGTKGHGGLPGGDGDPGGDVRGFRFKVPRLYKLCLLLLLLQASVHPLRFLSSGSDRSPGCDGRAWSVWCQGNQHNGSAA